MRRDSGNWFSMGRVARALPLNSGAPSLMAFQGRGFRLGSQGLSAHRIDANQTEFFL